MTDENSFMETIHSVREIISTAETPMSEKEILTYFDDMSLDAEQKQLVLAYLLNPENDTREEGKSTEEKPDAMREEESLEKEEIHSANVFQMYLDELSMLPTYSQKERDELYKKLLQGDAGVIDTILTLWLAKVIEVAKQYMEPKLVVEDLVQEGNMALLLALQDLCGSMTKDSVEDVLHKAVEQGIMEYVASIRDAHEREDALIGKMSLMHAAKQLLTEELGKIPTTKELAEYTKLPEKEVLELESLIEETQSK